MNPLPTLDLPAFTTVSTIYILLSGEMVESLEAYRKVADRFAWVNRRTILEKMFRLRNLTDTNKKSVIVIYEDGHQIREYVNVQQEFSPLSYC